MHCVLWNLKVGWKSAEVPPAAQNISERTVELIIKQIFELERPILPVFNSCAIWCKRLLWRADCRQLAVGGAGCAGLVRFSSIRGGLIRHDWRICSLAVDQRRCMAQKAQPRVEENRVQESGPWERERRNVLKVRAQTAEGRSFIAQPLSIVRRRFGNQHAARWKDQE